MAIPSGVLYYPNFDDQALLGIKASLFLYDRVSVIAPTATPYMGLARADGDDEELVLSPIEQTGVLLQSLQDVDLIDLIPDYQVVHGHQAEFLSALEEDFDDEEVQAWAARRKRRQSWLIEGAYLNLIPDLFSKGEYGIKAIPRDSGSLYRVPFLVGMSLGLSEALWAAVEGGQALYTDDPASEEFLMLRLRRGWKWLSHDAAIRRSLDIEDTFAKDMAAAQLGTWTLALQMPMLLNTIGSLSIEKILELRQDANRGQALRAFREGLDRIVSSHELWKASTFEEFEKQAREAVKKEILKPLEELEQHKIVSTKDIVSAFDAQTALRKTIESGRDLFVRSAVPATGVMASLAALGALHINWIAALGLLGGIGAPMVLGVSAKLGERLKARHDAHFMTYPVRIRAALGPGKG